MIHPIVSVKVNLELGQLDPFMHNFWVTHQNREYGILGLDMLKSTSLLINPLVTEITNQLTGKKVKFFTANNLPSSLSLKNHQITINKEQNFELECEKLLDSYPELTEELNYNKSVKHGHSLEIKVQNYELKMIKARKYNSFKCNVVEKSFQYLINRGALTRVYCNTTNFGVSPITIVPKKDDTMRVCIDYTELNKHSVPLSYPLPRIDELPQTIPKGTKYFSCLDIKEACYSLPIEQKSQHLAAIIAHHGVFIRQRTTFGLKNAPMRFQAMIESILHNCLKFTYIYLDDILVYSASNNKHLPHLDIIFHTL